MNKTFFLLCCVLACLGAPMLSGAYGLDELKKRAEGGDPDAQLELAKNYIMLSAPREVIKWLASAARQGNTEAQVMLGLQYETGRGVPENLDKARALYEKAARKDDWKGQYNLARLYEEGKGVLQDYVTAYGWFRMAATSGENIALERRDALAEKMTAEQLEQGVELSKTLFADIRSDRLIE